MSLIKKMFFVVLMVCTATAFGQKTQGKPPHIGYLYPAGGQQGTVFQILAGGQFLNGATEVYVSGQGVKAKVLRHVRPIGNLNGDQRKLLKEKLRQARNKRLTELGVNPELFDKKPAMRKPQEKPETKKTDNIADPNKPGDTAKQAKRFEIPKHPLLDDLENKSLKELAHISNVFFFPRNMTQINRQISESVLIEITIDPNAQLGDREIRILTRQGLTNPMVFQIGTLPEVKELEPNNQKAYPDILKALKIPNPNGQIKLPAEKPLRLPVVLNGQIMPGDVDRFRFVASKGQKLVIQAHARSLIPYLADTVPGWLQATLTLYDSKNKEVAFTDDYRFNPDPVLFYNIPKSGEYELQINDSIYRGREDFVYRISIGQTPFITQMFPLGGQSEVETIASVDGWNLPTSTLKLDTTPGDNPIRSTAYNQGNRISNFVTYAVDTLPQCLESNSNDTGKEAQLVSLPIIVDGKIDKPGDVDVFKFWGKAGDKIVAEVYGRKLNSPIDSLLRLTDSNGKDIAWNDDYIVKDGYLFKDTDGLETHPADSYLSAKLSKDGTYYVSLSDSQNHGGNAYGYRLRISQAVGDFALRVTPSSLYTTAGSKIPLNIYAMRKDGFDGAIELVLKDAPAGFKLSGGQIETGCNKKEVTLTAPLNAPAEPIALTLVGLAEINGKMVRHIAVPAEDMMQAFLYRHLVPSKQLLVAVKADKRSAARRKQARKNLPPKKPD